MIIELSSANDDWLYNTNNVERRLKIIITTYYFYSDPGNRLITNFFSRLSRSAVSKRLRCTQQVGNLPELTPENRNFYHIPPSVWTTVVRKWWFLEPQSRFLYILHIPIYIYDRIPDYTCKYSIIVCVYKQPVDRYVDDETKKNENRMPWGRFRPRRNVQYIHIIIYISL